MQPRLRHGQRKAPGGCIPSRRASISSRMTDSGVFSSCAGSEIRRLRTPHGCSSESATVGGLSLLYGIGLFVTFLRAHPIQEISDAPA